MSLLTFLSGNLTSKDLVIQNINDTKTSELKNLQSQFINKNLLE